MENSSDVEEIPFRDAGNINIISRELFSKYIRSSVKKIMLCGKKLETLTCNEVGWYGARSLTTVFKIRYSRDFIVKKKSKNVSSEFLNTL